MSGDAIPFPQARITIHQPRIKEIGYIGEEQFFTGCEFLNFSKEILSAKDKESLENYTDFEILMSMMNDKQNLGIAKQKVSAMMVLTLMFPEYKVRLKPEAISLTKEEDECFITKDNFKLFQEILMNIFCLKSHTEEYNPSGKMSSKIAEKLRRGNQRRNELKNSGKKEKISILNRYASILAVGLRKDINELMDYTVYQLNDEFQRFELKEEYDMFIKLKLAGAKDVKDVENWMKELHP